MAYHYRIFDNIFDIESVNNLFIDTHYFVAQHRIEIFYLSGVKGAEDFDHEIKPGKSIADVIRHRILQTLPELRLDKSLQINFYNLKNVANLKRYFKLYGVATNATAALAYMNNKGQILPPSQYDARRYYGGNSINLVHHTKPVNIKEYNDDLASYADNPYKDIPGAYNINFKYYPVKRTDPGFNPIRYGHGEMIGYNSADYDLVMIAHFLGSLIEVPVVRAVLNEIRKNSKKSRVHWPRRTIKADAEKLNAILQPKFMRDFNNLLFSSQYRQNMVQALIKHDGQTYFKRIETVPWYIYKGWKQTNRYLDISDLNRRVSLKRIEAAMGMQINESLPEIEKGKRGVKNVDELADFISYNLNDVYATRLTFKLPVYQDALTLREILLKKFPALIYSYDPKKVTREKATPKDVMIAPDNLRFTRLNSDFSSAQFIINVIAPYHAMKDIPGLNYLYPDPRVLKILHQEHPHDPYLPEYPVNVLDNTMRWAREQDRKYHTGGSIARNFFHVYVVYLIMQYHNVNPDLCDPKTGISKHEKRNDLDGVPRWISPYMKIKPYLRSKNMDMPYIKKDGKPSSCMVTFSIGGIHGLEFNQKKYLEDVRHWKKMKHLQDLMKQSFGADQKGAERIGSTFIIKNRGQIIATRPYVKGTIHGAQWRTLEPPHLLRKLSHSDRYVIRKRYAYIAVDSCQHEDFSGYYPMLISRLGSFWPHDQPTDMYRHLYIERLHLKHQLRKYTKHSPQWEKINLQQKLRKLLLNAGSGVGAGSFTNNLRMNNAIISMRIIGQLFAWRIGEAETLADGRVPSTNTDGMYVMDVSKKTNDKVLFDNVKAMMLDIIPSPLYRFVSKDTNNRVEVEKHGNKPVLTEANGATLRSWQGPTPSNHLSHPAVADWALANYLAYHGKNPSTEPFDEHAVMKDLEKMHMAILSKDKYVHALQMFQWIIMGNQTKHRYLFLQRAKWNVETHQWQLVGFNQLPRTNRVFLIKNDLHGIDHFIKIATKQEKKSDVNHSSDPYTEQVLKGHDDPLDKYHEYGKVIKVTDMPEHQNVYLNGKRLRFYNQQMRWWLYQHLDIHAYMKFVEVKFNTSWRNK